MDEKVRKLLDEQDWDTIIKRLTLHAYSRFKFWNLLSERGLKGYSPQEVALEAISLVYSGEWKWDPAKSDLVTYLKFHVINGLVSNLARNKEVLNTVFAPHAEAHFEYSVEEDLNARMVVDSIKQSLKNDDLLVEIFDCLLSGMKRNDIIESLSLQHSDYDNAQKRLKARLYKFRKFTIVK